MDTLHILIRVSTSSQEEENGGTSLITQSKLGIEQSKKLGMKYQIHDEGGTSSSKETLENRPVMLNLLQMMDEGLVKHLWVYNTDRLSRGHTWYVIRKKMVDNGVILYTSNGRYDTTGSMENMILGIMSEVSQYDNKVRTERSKLGKMEKVKDGYYRGGDPPFGYQIRKEQRGSKLELHPIESQYVKRIFTLYQEGKSIKSIKRFLETEGIKTRRGNSHWSLGTIQLILRNDTYLGIDKFSDRKSGVTIRNHLPPIISQTLFKEVQDRKLRTLQRKGQLNRSKRQFLLRDYMFCSCGTPIGGRVNPKKGVRQYYCPLTERKFNSSLQDQKVCRVKRCVEIDNTDDLIWNSIITTLENTSTLVQIFDHSLINNTSISYRLKSQRRSVQKELKEEQQKLDRIKKGLVDVERDRILNEDTPNEIREELRKRLNIEFRQTKLRIEILISTLEDYTDKDRWRSTLGELSVLLSKIHNWTVKRKKMVLDLLLNRVVLDHDPNTLLHTLHIHLKIPLVVGGSTEGVLRGLFRTPPQPPSTQGDQLQTRSIYSTVVVYSCGCVNVTPFYFPKSNPILFM